MSKVVLLFLIGIAILGIMGRIRMPQLFKKSRVKQAEKCAKCGTYQFDGVDCRCKKEG
ncbi:MAG: thymidine kinase [Pseudomonadota bacterium]